MNFRSFKLLRWRPLSLGLFWISLMVTLWIAQPTPAVTTPISNEIRGVWMTTNDLDILIDRPKLHDAIDQLARLNFNTIYPVVWNGGYVFYPSVTAERAGNQPFVRRGIQDYDILEEIITYGHERGLMVMPWFEFGFMVPTDSELAAAHPDWLTQRRNGNRTWQGNAGNVVWLNPFHPEVQQYLMEIVIEAVIRYDIDGIQFDDHFSLPNEFGYDAYTTALYETETGNAAPDPFNADWTRWRADKLTAFVQEMSDLVKRRKPGTIFSVAPNPYDYAYRGQLQDWITWVREGFVDELIVQVYRDNLGAFRSQLARPEVQEARRMIPTGIGVLTGLRNSPVPMNFIQAKVQSARAYGLGVAF
ncbi:MAG: glycoside hydrolase family 10 protein, partial [Cyanobacteria bacterium P01_D01_bin.44]